MQSISLELTLPGTNEVFTHEGVPRSIYGKVFEELEKTGPQQWKQRERRAHELLLDKQHSFGILEGDKTHPTDWFPRIIPASDWERLERGIAQRMRAINEFLRRLEAGKEEVVPSRVVESSILYDGTLPNRFGKVPARQVGFDVVATESEKTGQTGGWEYVVLEENVKMPVGLAAMAPRRRLCREMFFPQAYKELPVISLDGSLGRLGNALRAASPN